MNNVSRFRIIETNDSHSLYIYTSEGWELVFRANPILVGERQVRSLLNSYLDSIK